MKLRQHFDDPEDNYDSNDNCLPYSTKDCHDNLDEALAPLDVPHDDWNDEDGAQTGNEAEGVTHMPRNTSDDGPTPPFRDVQETRTHNLEEKHTRYHASK